MLRRTFLSGAGLALLSAAAFPAHAFRRETYGATLADHLRRAYRPWGLSDSMLEKLQHAPVFTIEKGHAFHEIFEDEFGLRGPFEWRLNAGRIVGVNVSAYAAFGSRAITSSMNLHELMSMRHDKTSELCDGPVIPVGIRSRPSDWNIDAYREAVAISTRDRVQWIDAPKYSRRFRNGRGREFIGTFGRYGGAYRTNWEYA